MAHKAISRVNASLKFLHRKNKYLTTNLRRLLCNTLIQPHFDYACSAWYPNLSKKLKNRIQTPQNKGICFCLQLNKLSDISQKKIETINCFPIKERYNKCLNSIPFKYVDNQCPHYLDEVFMKASESSSSLRNSHQKLQQPLSNTNSGQNALSFVGPALWSKVPKEIKRTTKLNAFKHNLEKNYLKELGKANF